MNHSHFRQARFKKGFIAPVVVIILAVLFLGGGAYVWKNETARSQWKVIRNFFANGQATSTQIDAQTAGWKTYQNKERGFEVKYPTDWYIDEGFRGVHISPLSPEDPLNASSAGLMSTLTISIEKETLQEILEAHRTAEAFSQKEVTFPRVTNVTQVTSIGQYAGETHYFFLIPIENEVIQIHYASAQKHLPKFESITRSFRFIPKNSDESISTSSISDQDIGACDKKMADYRNWHTFYPEQTITEDLSRALTKYGSWASTGSSDSFEYEGQVYFVQYIRDFYKNWAYNYIAKIYRANTSDVLKGVAEPVFLIRIPDDDRDIYEQAVYNFTIAKGALLFQSYGYRDDTQTPLSLNSIDRMSGKLLWRKTPARLLFSTTTATVIVNYSATDNGGRYAYTPQQLIKIGPYSGQAEWTFKSDSEKPTLIDDVLYVSDSNGFHALDILTGKEKWKYSERETFFGDVINADGNRVFVEGVPELGKFGEGQKRGYLFLDTNSAQSRRLFSFSEGKLEKKFALDPNEGPIARMQSCGGNLYITQEIGGMAGSIAIARLETGDAKVNYIYRSELPSR